jgi:hypothetical protein
MVVVEYSIPLWFLVQSTVIVLLPSVLPVVFVKFVQIDFGTVLYYLVLEY